jgi:hypothetical protein
MQPRAIRFGTGSIGLGDRGIRYMRGGLAPVFAGKHLSAPSGDKGIILSLGMAGKLVTILRVS